MNDTDLRMAVKQLIDYYESAKHREMVNLETTTTMTTTTTSMTTTTTNAPAIGVSSPAVVSGFT